MIPQYSRSRTAGRWAWRLAGSLALALLSIPLTACPPPVPPPANPKANHLCFSYWTTPVIDGVVGGPVGDFGWLESFRYVFQNGTSVPDAIVQGNRYSNQITLSFEVNNDQTLDQEDAILLGFSPGGGATNDRRIIIYPLFNGTVDPSGKPNHAYYSNDSPNWDTVTPIEPTWLKDTDTNAANDNVRVSASGTSWVVEVRIPILGGNADASNPSNDVGINLPASGAFGMYFNVIKVQPGMSAGSKAGVERPWPPDVRLAGNPPNNVFLLEANTPEPSTWGTGSLSGVACNGVSVENSDFVVEHPTAPNAGSSAVVLNQPNVFAVWPRNSSVDAQGNYIEARGIDADFKGKPFGITGPGQYILLPQDANAGGTNPTNLNVTLPASTATAQGRAVLRTGTWTPTNTNTAICSTVELHSSVPGTTFVNHRAYNNMYFTTTSSPFEETAAVSSHGYKLPEGAKQHNFLLRTFTYNTSPELRWETDISYASGGRSDPLKPSNGVRAIALDSETQVDIRARITPPAIKIPSTIVRVLPGTGGDRQRVITVPVVPSGIVTVHAQGALQLRKQAEGPFRLPSTPNGVTAPKAQEREKYLLSVQFGPSTRVGALIGSWDGFRESTFPIGSAMSFRAPADAKQLHLAINDSASGYAEQSGRGFEVQVIATALEPHFTRTDSAVSWPWGKSNKLLPLGANVPQWLLCGERATGKKINLNGTLVDLFEEAQCYGYIVRMIGDGR